VSFKLGKLGEARGSIMRLKMILVGVLLIVAVGLIIILGVKRNASTAPASPQKVNFGIHRGPHSSLIYLAIDQGFFRKNGIDATIREYEAGRLAVDALLAGDVDISTAPEYVHVSKSFANRDLRILATISTADDQEIIARRDRGIKDARDLKGKKIAAGREGVSRFFLETFLTSNDVPVNSIVSVNLLPSQMGEAIASGRVDAVSTFPPHTRLIKSTLGANAISWPSQNGQSYYFLLDAKESFIQSHQDLIEHILRSLIEAERYLKEDAAGARKMIEKRLNMSPEMLSSIWPQYQFRVRIDQDLIILMEDEAWWLINNKLSGGAGLPDFFRQIYLDGLVKVKPDAAGVFH
jgi:ABC-type nitrate/sulfonate/bicarbonate transport system substrate-binding protein